MIVGQSHSFDSSGNSNTQQEQTPPRSVDDYLETAYRHANIGNRLSFRDMLQHWRYYIIFLGLGIANSGDSAELGLTNYLLSSVHFQRDILSNDGEDGAAANADFARRGASIAGAHFAGMLISGIFSGILADVWGRRATLLLGLTCNATVGVLSAGARNAADLCFLRFLLGIGLGMVIAGVVTLCAELSIPSKRGRTMTLVGACYTLGFLFTAFVALVVFGAEGSGNWRLFCVLNALPSVVAASLVAMFVPESPRFFLCRRQTKEAVFTCNTLATRMGTTDNLLTEEELTNSIDSNEREDTSYLVVEGTFLEELCTSLVRIKQVFAHGMHRRTIPLQMTYFSITLVTGVMQWSTKIFQILELHTDAYTLSLYHTLAQIPGMMIASCLIDRLGRRRLIFLGFGGSTATLILLSAMCTTIRKSEEQEDNGEPKDYYSVAVLGLACTLSVFLCIGWLSADCLSAESFPTEVRSTGRGVCVTTGRMGGFFVQFLYGPLINDNRLSYMLGLASLFGAGGMIVSYFTTDTTNIGLQDHYLTLEASSSDGEYGSHKRHEKYTPFSETKHK